MWHHFIKNFEPERWHFWLQISNIDIFVKDTGGGVVPKEYCNLYKKERPDKRKPNWRGQT